MTALLVVPLCGSVGLAVDFSSALSVRSQLRAAADAAAVGSVSLNSAAVTAVATMTGNGEVAIGAKDAKSIFKGQLSGQYPDMPVDVSAVVTKQDNVISSRVTYSAAVPTVFMQIFGHKTIEISGVSTAQYETASFMDFYILLDNTPSMGVAATPSDVSKMVAATGCAFACHAEKPEDNVNWTKAKALGITLRIDVVREATKQLTQTAQTSRAVGNQFRMGVFTFGDKAQTVKLTKISDLTYDLAQVGKLTDAVDLMTIPNQGYNNDQITSFDTALTSINDYIDTPGTGANSNSPEKILFFVADGVGDSSKPAGCTKPLSGATRCQEPIDLKYCKKLKDRGIRIAVLYTTYLPLPNNSWYNSWIKPFQAEIGPRMSDCATPGYYFEVSPTQGIAEAMKALFLKVIRSPRLTG